MVAVTGIFVGYVVGFLYPNFLSGSNPDLSHHGLVASCSRSLLPGSQPRGAGALHAVSNISINVIQISALIVF